jgi:formylglycine-generating enzyme required for sulfatase activity
MKAEIDELRALIMKYHPEERVKEYTVNGVSFRMVKVDGGTFQMGATEEQESDAMDSEKPVHSVTLSDYSIGETEVTQALWYAVMGYKPTSGGSQWESSYGLGDEYPVYWISWNDCQTFISKLNELTGLSFRLPTEAEWEFAARGGNNSQGYKYAGSNTVDDVAWYYENSLASLGSSNPDYGTHVVGTKSPNELGLYDMSGNVWEWCHDWYDSYSSNSQTNPTGPSSGSSRVSRGGSWINYAKYCRVSFRYYGTPSGRYYNYGLRLAL